MKIFHNLSLKIFYQLVVALDILALALTALVSCLVLETQIFPTSSPKYFQLNIPCSCCTPSTPALERGPQYP